jgi:hypothetical protein
MKILTSTLTGSHSFSLLTCQHHVLYCHIITKSFSCWCVYYSHSWLTSKVLLIQGFIMWTSGGLFLSVCEELTSLGPHLQSACNITFQNWKHVCSGICKSYLCIWGRGPYFNITFICLLGSILFGLHVIINILGYFFKWDLAPCINLHFDCCSSHFPWEDFHTF